MEDKEGFVGLTGVSTADVAKPASHTPGPWTVEAHHRQGYDRLVPVWYVKSANSVGIAVQPSFSDPVSEQANARLIAAAPCLLDALLTVLGDADHGQNMSWGDRCKIGRAAVLKATKAGA